MKYTCSKALSLLVIVAGVSVGQHAGAAERPNVLLVLTDDQGYGDLSCHGNPVLGTPNLDRLYAESIRFTDQSWFYNQTGKDLGGSYFVYVTKRPPTTSPTEEH